MAEAIFLRDSETTLQAQLKSDAFETYENNMTLNDASPSHAPRDTGHDSGERILDAGDGPDQTVTVAMLATRFVENVKVRLQSLNFSSNLEIDPHNIRSCCP
jgi:hypothetical protein